LRQLVERPPRWRTLVGHRRVIILVFLPFVAGFYLSYLFRTINALIADKLASRSSADPN